MFRQFGQSLVSLSGTLLDALRALDQGAIKIALVVDERRRLVGAMTDGDFRRALLAGSSLESPLAPHINRRLTTLGPASGRVEALELMQARSINQVPVVDEDGHILGVHLLRDIVAVRGRENWAIVMAGGLGTRLGALTRNTPKPMLRVAGRPILERIVLHLAGHGIRRIFLSVNYLASIIEDYFEDGRRFGVEITYLREDRPLGTGGALGLLPQPPTRPVVVMNGDLVTQANVGDMLAFHMRHGGPATVGVRRYFHQIPFGCVEVDGDRLLRFDEKPTVSRLVNAGIYILSPEMIARVPRGQSYPLPQLFTDGLDRGELMHAYEIADDWIDVGQHEQLREARGES